MTVPERIEVATQELVPVLGQVLDVDRAAAVGERCEQRIDRHSRRQVQPAILQIAQARREPVAEERHQPEDVVRRAARVDRVLLDRQAGLMVEQPVEHVRRLAGGRRDHLGVERAVLV